MPDIPSESKDAVTGDSFEPLTKLPFPPLSKQHIKNCAYNSWYSRLRSHTPKARLIPLNEPFLDYLRADGIILPPSSTEPGRNSQVDGDDSGFSEMSDSDDDEAEEDNDDSFASWRDIHMRIRDTIAELGGKVTPKLSWSAPKDATWISATNDMECRSPDDVYMLLKSSDFITHDLEHAFDDCVDESDQVVTDQVVTDQVVTDHHDHSMDLCQSFTYHLILRKAFNLNPALEFRCFVRDRVLIALCQRDQNHFDFLFQMRSSLLENIQAFLTSHLLPNFPDPSFAFDVYIPPPHDRVWLIDINPWAIRTDPLLFSWLELLQMPAPELNSDDTEDTRVEEEEDLGPTFRLIGRDDPEAYQFNTTKFSAHKLPKDVVDASLNPTGGGVRELMDEWQRAMDMGRRDGAGDESDSS
ncbi:MAG: hypothetical protein Q9227_008226 [Pyrenula ochraceoflavens]